MSGKRRVLRLAPAISIGGKAAGDYFDAMRDDERIGEKGTIGGARGLRRSFLICGSIQQHRDQPAGCDLQHHRIGSKRDAGKDHSQDILFLNITFKRAVLGA